MFGRILLMYIRITGEDVTEAFKAGGTTRVSKKLKAQQITTLILKEKVPAVAARLIYDGQFFWH